METSKMVCIKQWKTKYRPSKSGCTGDSIMDRKNKVYRDPKKNKEKKRNR